MKILNILYILLIFGILLSCDTEIQFNGKVTEPVLVVNALACTDSIIHTKVSLSRFFLDQEDDSPPVTDATVALYVNGTFRENLVHFKKGEYLSTYVTVQGDVIRLNVSAPGQESVWSETTVPLATADFQIDSTIVKSDTSLLIYTVSDNPYEYNSTYHFDTVGVTYNYTHTYKVSFSNPVGVSNYYRLVVNNMTTFNGRISTIEYRNDIEDIVFGSGKNNLDGLFAETGDDPYNVFSDELIDGTTHTITFKYQQDFNRIDNRPSYVDSTIHYERSVTVDLQSISRAYYLYLKSLKALGLADPFMSEPVQIYTNIDKGLGILGARTHQLRKFVLPE